MKVTPSFKGALNNKYLLSGLKNISEHGTSFAAVTTLFMSTGLRTFSILKTPSVAVRSNFAEICGRPKRKTSPKRGFAVSSKLGKRRLILQRLPSLQRRTDRA